MNDIIFVLYDKQYNKILKLYETHGQAYAELRDFAASDEVIINDTTRSGVCIKRLTVFQLLKLALEGTQHEL